MVQDMVDIQLGPEDRHAAFEALLEAEHMRRAVVHWDRVEQEDIEVSWQQQNIEQHTGMHMGGWNKAGRLHLWLPWPEWMPHLAVAGMMVHEAALWRDNAHFRRLAGVLHMFERLAALELEPEESAVTAEERVSWEVAWRRHWQLLSVSPDCGSASVDRLYKRNRPRSSLAWDDPLAHPLGRGIRC